MAQTIPFERQKAITRRLVGTLRERRVPAVGFVNGDKLLVNGVVDAGRLALLRQWLEAGLQLGNHGFSHRDLHQVGVAEFQMDIARGEDPLRTLLPKGTGPLYFRHPFLHTGRSIVDRIAIERFLADRGFRVAPVTIDNSDWIFSRAYDHAVADHDDATRVKLVREYVRYMMAKIDYFDRESEFLFKRPIRQVLLVHANALNADAFGTLVNRMRASGHRLISLERALSDVAYGAPDAYIGPAGISWLDRWALTRGVSSGFFVSEPRTAPWVMKLAGVEKE